MRYLLLILTIVVFTQNMLAAEPVDPLCGRAYKGEAFAKPDRWVSSEQVKYDALYYAIDASLVPDSNITHGTYLTRLAIVDSTISQIELDYTNMGNLRTIHWVTLNDSIAEYTHSNDLIVIPLDTGASVGDTLEIRVSSSTGPENNCDNCGFNWDSYLGNRHIYTDSQPYDARDWWPCKDYPQDKPDSVDIIITVPEGQIVASNGVLRSETANGDGTTTFHWHEGYPIATYLVSIAVYPYFIWGEEFINLNGDTVPLVHYTYRDTLSSQPSYLVPNYRMLPEMLSLYTELFGEYPFKGEKYGHAEWGKGYGMEHQTLTSMGDPTERRVCHELAHMWWGDMITCDSYHHIWLNEGFARYAEALWWEHTRGVLGYREKMEIQRYEGTGTIYVEDPENENIFNFNLSYNKASWVLHMLRHVVGDSTFFDILHTYGETPGLKHATATTEQFQAVCEEVSGMDLANFFQQWIYGQNFPHYLARWGQNEDTLSVEIIQQGTNFDMPLDLAISIADSMLWTSIQVVEGYEEFLIPLPAGATVTSIALDPYDWVLRDVQIVLATESGIQLPDDFKLTRVFPNPFNQQISIEYSLPSILPIQLKVFDLQGRMLYYAEYMAQNPGDHTIAWNGRDHQGRELSSGVYLISLSTGMESLTQKVALVR